MLKQISKKIRGLYEDYNEIELVSKEIEEVIEELTLISDGQNTLLEQFKEFQKEIGANKSTERSSEKSSSVEGDQTASSIVTQTNDW